MKKYDNGTTAVDIGEDGSGFVYYSNGAVAICISPGTESHQFCYYAFDSNRSKTMLMGIDELGNGFCTTSKRKSTGFIDSHVICLSENRGFHALNSKIEKEWNWKTSPLTDYIDIPINEHLSFRVKDKKNMELSFTCETIRETYNVGLKLKREDTYLDHCKRQPGGKIIPGIQFTTLKQRQSEFNESMKAKRNIIHPKSENLSDMVKGIVAKLEVEFGSIDSKMHSSCGIGHEWQSLALSTTLSEIPRLPLVGTETGVFTGFGENIYSSTGELNFADTIPKNLRSKSGTWKGEVEIRSAIREANPPLPRAGILRANSGRYSDMLVVDRKAVTANNPTGMITRQGLPLPFIPWSQYQQMVKTPQIQGAASGPGGPVLMALVLRRGDPLGGHCEYVVELLNRHLSEESQANNTLKTRFRMFKIDVSEDSSVLDSLGIKHLPVFVMYQNSRLVYAGPIGGKKVKAATISAKPQLLVIEPNVKYQILAEKTLRKHGCDTYLCLNVREALERIQQFNMTGIVFDAVLISDSINTADLSVLSQKLAEKVKSKRTIMCGLATVLGDNGARNLRGVPWDDFTSTQVETLLPTMLAGVVQVMMQSPIKASAIDKVLGMRVIPHSNVNIGLTQENLEIKMTEILDELDRNARGHVDERTTVGIRLSTEDVKLRGVSLTK